MEDRVVVHGPGEPHRPVILLVEDEVLVRLTTAEILRDEGYDVLEAVDASEALAILATGHPLELVLTDIRMPGDMDGIELTSTIRTRRPYVPIVILSSHLADGTKHEADRFLVKPYQTDQLLQTVNELVDLQWQLKRATPNAS